MLLLRFKCDICNEQFKHENGMKNPQKVIDVWMWSLSQSIQKEQKYEEPQPEQEQMPKKLKIIYLGNSLNKFQATISNKLIFLCLYSDFCENR